MKTAEQENCKLAKKVAVALRNEWRMSAQEWCAVIAAIEFAVDHKEEFGRAYGQTAARMLNGK